MSEKELTWHIERMAWLLRRTQSETKGNQRLGQIISNAIGDKDLYYLEDHALVSLLGAYLLVTCEPKEATSE